MKKPSGGECSRQSSESATRTSVWEPTTKGVLRKPWIAITEPGTPTQSEVGGEGEENHTGTWGRPQAHGGAVRDGDSMDGPLQGVHRRARRYARNAGPAAASAVLPTQSDTHGAISKMAGQLSVPGGLRRSSRKAKPLNSPSATAAAAEASEGACHQLHDTLGTWNDRGPKHSKSPGRHTVVGCLPARPPARRPRLPVRDPALAEQQPPQRPLQRNAKRRT